MRLIVTTLLGIFILAVQQAYGKQCTGFSRNADRCRAYTADEEYRCIATENGLQAIMDCVSIEGGAEKFFCRDGRDGFESTAENYYESDYAGRRCVTPRSALLLMSRNQCFFCGLTGILKACPMDDPCFLECLCENHVTDEHLTCLATCFNIKLESPTCTNGGCSSTHRKRHAAGTTARDKWAMNDDSTRWFTVSLGQLPDYLGSSSTELTITTGRWAANPDSLHWILRSLSNKWCHKNVKVSASLP